eukprot:212623_1
MSELYLICIPISSMIILILVLLMHAKHHYSSCICLCNSNDSKVKYSYVSQTANTQNRIWTTYNNFQTNCFQKYPCQLVPITGEKYHTFVPAFLRYTIFIIFSCCLVTLIQIISSVQNNNTIIPILNYILVYQVLIISIWESSFTFVRYYATRGTTQFYHKMKDMQIYKRFCIYIIIFSILYLFQIHIYYYILPIITIMNVSFNMYYNYQFGAILLKQYKAFQFEDEFIDIVEKVKFLQRISIIYSISQSLSLTVFIISYNNININIISNIVYTMPLFWCISSSVYAISFVKNQTHFKNKCKCFNYSNYKQHTSPNAETEEAPKDIICEKPKIVIMGMGDAVKSVESNKSIEPTDDELFAAMPSIKKTVLLTDESQVTITNTIQTAPMQDITVLKKTAPMHSSKSAPVTLMINDSPATNLNIRTPARILEENSNGMNVKMEALDLEEMEKSVNISIECTLRTLSTMKSYGFLPDVDTVRATKSIRKITTRTLRKAKSNNMW